MTVKERLKKYLKQKNISASEFGRVIGVSNAYISSMVKSISPDKLQRITLNYPDLNTEWLLTGMGEMLRSDQVRDPMIFEPQPVELQMSIGITMEYLVAENKKKDAEIKKLTRERDDAMRQLRESGKQSTKAGVVPSKESRRN